ncbi:MAG: HlyD family efflux transporter periplasmic adaptor subunit [Bacteroidota bacterium]
MKSSWLSVIVLLLLVACKSAPEQERPAEEPSDKALTTATTPSPNLIKKEDLILQTIAKGSRTNQTTISGRVIPRNTTQLSAEVQGKIQSGAVVFKAGNAFQKGDVLLKINQKEFELGLEAQRSAFLNALTGLLPDMKSDYPDSYQQWLDYAQSFQFGTPLPPLPNTQSDEERFFVTTNQIYNLFYAIKAQEERLTKYRIVAPYSGIITQSSIDVGSLVNPGQALGTIISRYEYELEAGIDLAAANRLKIGDQLAFTSNEIEGKWMGKVVRINNIIDPQTQNIPVYFRLKGKNLRSGMYLEGTFTKSKLNDVAIIPNSALGRDDQVLILQGDVIQRKEVVPVEYTGDSIIVTGLNDNDQLILNQFDVPVEGNKIKI